MDAGSDAAGTGEPTPEIGIDTCDFGVVDAVVADFVEDRSLNGAGLAVVDAEGVVHEECWGEPLYEPYLCQFLDGDLQECGRIIATTPDDDADVIAPDTEYW